MIEADIGPVGAGNVGEDHGNGFRRQKGVARDLIVINGEPRACVSGRVGGFGVGGNRFVGGRRRPRHGHCNFIAGNQVPVSSDDNLRHRAGEHVQRHDPIRNPLWGDDDVHGWIPLAKILPFQIGGRLDDFGQADIRPGIFGKQANHDIGGKQRSALDGKGSNVVAGIGLSFKDGVGIGVGDALCIRDCVGRRCSTSQRICPNTKNPCGPSSRCRSRKANNTPRNPRIEKIHVIPDPVSRWIFRAGLPVVVCPPYQQVKPCQPDVLDHRHQPIGCAQLGLVNDIGDRRPHHRRDQRKGDAHHRHG